MRSSLVTRTSQYGEFEPSNFALYVLQEEELVLEVSSDAAADCEAVKTLTKYPPGRSHDLSRTRRFAICDLTALYCGLAVALGLLSSRGLASLRDARNAWRIAWQVEKWEWCCKSKGREDGGEVDGCTHFDVDGERGSADLCLNEWLRSGLQLRGMAGRNSGRTSSKLIHCTHRRRAPDPPLHPRLLNACDVADSTLENTRNVGVNTKILY